MANHESPKNSKRKGTKAALAASFAALLLCGATLVGTTFAWFTDTASTSVNTIQAGTLDIELLDANGNLLSEKLKFTNEEGSEDILWEPGVTYNLTPFKLANKGNLWLKYTVAVEEGTTEANEKNADLLDVIDFYVFENVNANTDIKGAIANGEATKMADYFAENASTAKTLAPNGEANATTPLLTIVGHMQEGATNEYQGLTLDGVSLNIYATQYTKESDSFNDQYDADAAYETSAKIVGIDGSFDTLTDAARAWRTANTIQTEGNAMGNYTTTPSDTLQWLISGTVETGNGTGVNGAGVYILQGGYVHPQVNMKTITVKGVGSNATIKNTLTQNDEDDYLSAKAENVIFDSITFPEYVHFNADATNVTFKNCTFKNGLKVLKAENVTVENCTFTNEGTRNYAFFGQNIPNRITFRGNTINDYTRGINIHATTQATVLIDNNSITSTKQEPDRGAIQLTEAKSFTVTNNIIDVNNGNAFWFHSAATNSDVTYTINNNNISALYLANDETSFGVNGKITSYENIISSTTNTTQCMKKDATTPTEANVTIDHTVATNS